MRQIVCGGEIIDASYLILILMQVASLQLSTHQLIFKAHGSCKLVAPKKDQLL